MRCYLLSYPFAKIFSRSLLRIFQNLIVSMTTDSFDYYSTLPLTWQSIGRSDIYYTHCVDLLLTSDQRLPVSSITVIVLCMQLWNNIIQDYHSSIMLCTFAFTHCYTQNCPLYMLLSSLCTSFLHRFCQIPVFLQFIFIELAYYSISSNSHEVIFNLQLW